MIPEVIVSWIECVLDAVWIVDLHDLNILAVNEAAVLLLGLSRHELIGRCVTDFTASPEDSFFWEDVAAGNQQTLHSETRMLCGDGQALQVERRISPLPLGSHLAGHGLGHRETYVVCMRDRSQQRRMEDELELVLAEMQATLEATADGILVCNLDGGIAACNRRFADLWDVPETMLVRRDEQALQSHMASLMLDPAAYRQQLSVIESNPLSESSDLLVLHNGRLMERMTLPQHSQGRSIGRVYSFRDITQRVEAESGLRLAAKVFESSLDAIFIAGPDHRIMAVNPGCVRLTRYSQQELIGRPAPELFSEAEEANLFERMQARWSREGYWDGEALHSRGDGSICPVQLSWVVLRDEQGEVRQSIGFFKDLTEKKASQQRIEQLAYTDLLTGLPNRLMLSQRVDFAVRLAERDGGEFAVLFMDLDRFKNINDSLGHVFGDRVLVEVAGRIATCLRQVDTLCRLGGDEFVAYLHQADVAAAETVARRILESLAQPFMLEKTPFSVSSSIGVAMFPNDGQTLDDLIKCADTAMYRVKERGRANFRFYQRQMNVEMLSRMKMDHAMRLAMENGLFRLHYQPQVRLSSGQVVGVEALIRWLDPELGHVSPADFIPLAEETGYIVTIGTWVLGEAVRQAAKWQHMGWPTVVSVNVSALQFQQGDFVDHVAAALAREGLAPELLELELTESILVKDAAEALARLEALAALGVTLSIDDFGTGYSSLAYLKKFPIHKLKIDRSFISGLPEDENDHAIVSAIIQMGRALKLTVIAEGVETIAQRAMLQHLQCDQYQGYLCAPGLPAEELERTIETVRERAARNAA